MFNIVARRFSRLSTPRARTRQFQNIINVTDEVRFHKISDPPDYCDSHERESREIDGIYKSKFINRNRRNDAVESEATINRFIPHTSTNSKSSKTSFENQELSFKRNKGFAEEELDYNFKEEPGEFFEFEKFESLKKNPRYQDLTHEERQFLQEIQVRSNLRDPFNRLNTNKAKADPVRDAKELLRESSRQEPSGEQEFAIESIGENEETSLLDKRIVDQNKFDEVVSRIRTKIRIEKKQNSEIGNLKIPNVGGVVVDPIRKHVLRRAARIGTMLHTHIEQLFTCNNPEFLYKYLNGASISINHVEMPTSKSTVKCYYNILSKHDPKQVQRNLDLAAPKVRFMIARKLELGYTPPVKFIKYDRSEFVNVKRRAQLLEAAFNLTLEGTSDSSANGLVTARNPEDSDDRIVIRDDQITPEMNREIQESFHRRFCGYP